MTGATLGMSLEAMIWALEQAPDVPHQCVGVLMGLANHADPQGRGAYAGQKLLAGYARKGDRSVRNDLTPLLALGLIRKGDQSLAAHIPADCRPIVYDLALERKQASARNSPSARKQASRSTADWLADQQESGGTGSTVPGEDARERKPASGGERKQASYKPGTNQEKSSTKTSRAPRRDLNEGREDVMRLCVHLADRLEAGESLRPAIGKEWLDAARLMLDTDKRDEAKVHIAIDWCQDHDWWRSRVMSMPKLRKQYDTLRLQAQQEKAGPNGNGRANGYQPYQNPADDSAYDARY